MKKLIKCGVLTIGVLCLCFGLASCKEDPATSKNFEPQNDTIKIESLEITTDKAIIEGESCMAVKYNNKTQFTIAALEINYDFKKDVTDEQIKKVWGSKIDGKNLTMEKMKDWPRKVEFTIPVQPENKSIERPIVYAASVMTSYAIENQEQYDLLEPSKAKIYYKATGSKLYEETYDYKNNAYGLSSKVVDLNSWPDNELGKMVPDPSFEYTVPSAFSESSLSADVLNIESNDCNNYIEKCKQAGFTNISSNYTTKYNISFSAKSSDNKYDLDVSYNIPSKKMKIYARKM